MWDLEGSGRTRRLGRGKEERAEERSGCERTWGWGVRMGRAGSRDLKGEVRGL